MDCFINGLTCVERPMTATRFGGIAYIKYVRNGKPGTQIFRDIAEAYHFYSTINCALLQQQDMKNSIFERKGR